MSEGNYKGHGCTETINLQGMADSTKPEKQDELFIKGLQMR